MVVSYYCRMDLGPRGNQEDCVLLGDEILQENHIERSGVIESPGVLLAVCDGLGGHAGGERASRYVCGRLLDVVARPDSDLENLHGLLAGIQEESLGAGLPRDSGATAAGLILKGDRKGDRAVAFNAGDSRVYRLDRGGAARMSHDHSMVQRMVDAGHMRPEEAHTSPFKNIVDFGVGPAFPGRWEKFEVAVREEALSSAACYLICSDGVSDVLRDEEIAGAFGGDPERTGRRLSDALGARGLADNTSFIVARVEG